MDTHKTQGRFQLHGGTLSNLLVLARGAFVAALLSAAGASLFGALFAPAPARRVLPPSLGIALAAGLGLLALQAESMAGSLTAVPTVLRATLFGHVLAIQLAALAAGRSCWSGGAAPGRLCRCAGSRSGCSALHLHGWAMEGRVGPLVASELLHLAAGAARGSAG